MFSIVYFPSENEVELEVGNETIVGGADALLILKSRKVEYGLKLTGKNKKVFLMRFWICGPPHDKR